MANEDKNEEVIFHTAIQLKGSAERDAYLTEACGSDPKLRADVESLLLAHGGKSLIDSPIFEDDVTLGDFTLTEVPGTVIGRYKLLEKIGEGGMAVVYMAEQEKPVRRKVALKIIKLGMDTKSVIARFEAERQALAMMDHPNIAKVLDAGATDTGRPYFVMELVTGVSITEYCDKNRVSTKERLGLFIQVCNAVQHAHQKGIIHRDIKPSNVMVTHQDGMPVPKVIDFGIAKATNQRLTEKTLFTRYAHIIGTPAYMSPEQAEMSDLGVDTRTDIYSLGVLFYELLTGTTPFDEKTLREAGYAEMQRIIRETDPLRPSTKLSASRDTIVEVAERRHTNPETLKKLIKGDLDWIVMKCLEKDRTRRYETSHALAEDIERHLKNEPVLTRSPTLMYRTQKFWRRHRSHIVVAATGAVLLGGLVVMILMYRRASNLQWAKGEALPKVIELVKERDYPAAFSWAQKARKYIPQDATLMELWPRICKDYLISTTPTGADVFYREYRATDKPWQHLGCSPLENITLPHGTYRWKIEKEGFTTHECVADYSFDVRLLEEGLTGEMAWIDAWAAHVHEASYAESTTVETPAYLIDKYEVTNEQFKRFVDQGGYEKHEFWTKTEFIKEGHEISWEQAINEFVDKTGQPGPATWEGGTYPEGQGQYPVSGVSWFEADAYAKFTGKSLPTVHHWQQAACVAESLVIVPFSNFDMEGTVPVGSNSGMGHTGLYDMAGNVKEWCLNATDDSDNLRYILGGGWGEPTYMFVAEDSRSPWDRSPLNGFRCVAYTQGAESLPRVLFRPLKLYPMRDLSNLEPFTDEEFRSLKAQYKYDRTPLNPVIENIEGHSPFWREEKITFDAAYGGERVIAYLFLPKTVKPPYQTVIYFPGVGAVYGESFEGLLNRHLNEYVIISGRALLFPIYKGTFERPAARGRIWTMASVVETPLAYRDWTIQIAKDLGRCIDYLETRDDIHSDKIAFYGMSWGATLGPIMMAVEDRLATGIFFVGGIPPIDLPRSFDIALYAQRVKAPVLMVNGREDVFLPLKISQEPLYQLLGTPDEHKKHTLYPGGHGMFGLFYEQIRGDILDWLDRYLGPVE